MEILIIDGGSTDHTREIALKYNATIIENPRRLPEFAKKIGFRSAKGVYGIFLDSDEIISNMDCFRRRLDIFEKYDSIKCINSTGGPAPQRSNGICHYATRVGDPFSNFVYYFYNGDDYLKTMVKQFDSTYIEEDGYIFNYSDSEYYPLFDGQGTTISIEYAKKVQEEMQVEDITTDVFCNIVSKTKKSCILKNDYIIHDQQMSTGKYLSKIKWKVKNNVFAQECVGFSSRENTQKKLAKRKYLFIPYCLFILPVLGNSLRLTIQEKKMCMMNDFIVTYYTFFIICLYIMIKVLKIPVKKDSIYGKK